MSWQMMPVKQAFGISGNFIIQFMYPMTLFQKTPDLEAYLKDDEVVDYKDEEDYEKTTGSN